MISKPFTFPVRIWSFPGAGASAQYIFIIIAVIIIVIIPAAVHLMLTAVKKVIRRSYNFLMLIRRGAGCFYNSLVSVLWL